MTLPLVLLAIPSVAIGYFTIEPMLFGEFFRDSIVVDAVRHPAMAELRGLFHGRLEMAKHALSTAPFWLALGGVVLAFLLYMVFPSVPAAIRRSGGFILNLLDHKYYLDWFNEHVIARGARGIGYGLWQRGDQKLIDGLLVNGSWKSIGATSAIVRWFQSGFVYHYALVMVMGVFVLLTWVRLVQQVVSQRVATKARQRKNNNMGLLSLAIWIPILSGVAVLVLGRPDQVKLVRWVALGGAIAGLLVTLPLYTGFQLGTAAMQFTESAVWIRALQRLSTDWASTAFRSGSCR